MKVPLKKASSNIGQVLNIALIFGLSRLFGELIIHSALLKIHLWYNSYYSPLL